MTFAYWWLSGDREHALIRTATVLIIACPHALGLAIPLVIAISTSLGAQNGLLVKDRLALERARNLDVVIFDKTGTLTRGAPAVSAIAAAPGAAESGLLAAAAAVESQLRAPACQGRRRRGQTARVYPYCMRRFRGLAGRGAQATVDGRLVMVGGPRLLTRLEQFRPPEVERIHLAWAAKERPSCTSSQRAASSAPSPPKTRSGPSPSRPSTSFTASASASP